MGLSENEVNYVWKEKVEAEVRSLYFGELTSRNTRRKQFITGISFFLSSGAAATIVAKLPAYVPVTLAVVSALAAAYSMAVDLDKRISTLAELHCQWNQLSMDYSHLWNRWYDETAEERLRELEKRASEASGLGVKMPNDEPLMDKWEKRVYARFAPAQ